MNFASLLPFRPRTSVMPAAVLGELKGKRLPLIRFVNGRVLVTIRSKRILRFCGWDYPRFPAAISAQPATWLMWIRLRWLNRDYKRQRLTRLAQQRELTESETRAAQRLGIIPKPPRHRIINGRYHRLN